MLADVTETAAGDVESTDLCCDDPEGENQNQRS